MPLDAQQARRAALGDNGVSNPQRMAQPENRGTSEPLAPGAARAEASPSPPPVRKLPDVPPTRTATKKIYIHNYLSPNFTIAKVQPPYGVGEWIAHLRHPSRGDHYKDIEFVRGSWQDDPLTAVGRSLEDPGAIVLLFIHGVVRPDKRPVRDVMTDEAFGTPRVVPITKLRGLVAKAKAKVFILAACDTDRSFAKLDADVAVIATNSGQDKATDALDWAGALGRWFDAFAQSRTINEALAKANEFFQKKASNDKDRDDRLVLVSGNGSMTRYAPSEAPTK